MKRIIFFAGMVLLLCLIGETVQGQYYFGRNKVQYNNFQWHILKTEHFDIYFYPEMKELAEIGASFAEESYKFLEDKFNHNIGHRIPLIFYATHAHFQQTNTIPYLLPEGVGGFFEYMKGRVVIPANGSIYDFKRVIRHELIHVFTYSKVTQILKDHKRSSYADLPLWFVEGLAEYWSEGWESEAEMFIRDAVLNGYLVPLGEMYRIYGSFLMYKEGQAILKYIAETYGEEKILQLIENIWKEDKFSNVMKLTIGVDYKEFDKDWTYYFKKKKYPLMQDNDFPNRVAISLTKEGVNTKPAFYKTGEERKVVFVSNRTGYSNIYVQPLKETQKPEVLIEGERTSEFEAFHLLNSKIDVNSEGLLTFVSKSGEKDALYVYDIEKKTMVHRFTFDNLVSMFSPAWSPDGTKIAFTAVNFSGISDLYSLEVTNGKLTKLTNDLYDDRDPSWTPDGNAICFSSDRTVYGQQGFYNLFIIEMETGQIQIVTYGPQNDLSPRWSPDGKYLAFSSDRNGSFNIWMLEVSPRQFQHIQLARLNGIPGLNSSGDSDTEVQYGQWPTYPSAANEENRLKRVTNFITGAFDPVWTDGGDILFTAFDNFSMQIMHLKNALDKFEQSPLAAVDSIVEKRSFWQVEKLKGQTAASAVKYKRKFNLDVAQSQITQDPIFGTSGGAQLAMTDMLGNEQYYFLIFNNAQTKEEFFESFNVAVSRVDLSRRTNFAVGLYHFAGRYYNYAEGFFYERRYGGFGAISYPFSVFKRLEGSLNIRKSDKDWYGAYKRINALLVSNYISFIKDNSLWGPTGPMDGERYNFTLGNTLDIQHSDVNFYTIIADYRKYFRLSRRMCYAMRLTGQFNHGKEALRFFMGGSWDLRGYRRWTIWGKKIALVSNELRFPFIDHFIINFPFGGLGFSSIRGATFVDVGNAWDEKLEDLLGSFGFGIRFRVGGVLVLRFDYGKKFAMHRLRGWDALTDIEFQRGTFKQFFFGWDF